MSGRGGKKSRGGGGGGKEKDYKDKEFKAKDFKGYDKQHSTNGTPGVYDNHRFMQTVGALVGLPVQVLTTTKETFEGVLTAFSPKFEIVLDWPHTVVGCVSEYSVICNVEGIKRKMIFDVQNIVQIRVMNVNMDYASKGTFATDSQISSKPKYRSSEGNGGKHLEPWQGGELKEIDLEGENANGWDADDMFKKNEEKYGVQTSYNPNMEGYTTPLQKKNTKEYKEQEAMAQMIALEIAQSPTAQARATLENGDDEEERFAAVERSEQTASKYITPQRRNKIQGESGKQPSRGSPSPQSTTSGPAHTSASRYNNHNSSPTSSQQNSPIATSTMGPPSSSSYASQTKLQTSKTLQHPANEAKLNGDNKEPRRHDYGRERENKENVSQGRENFHNKETYSQNKESYSQNKESYSQNKEGYSTNKENYSTNKENYSTNKENYSHSKENYAHPKDSYSQDGSHGSHHHHSQSFSHTQTYHSSNDSRRSEPREQREPRKPRSQKDEQLADLRKFGQDFNLTESVDKKTSQQIMHKQNAQMQSQQQSQYQASQHPPSSLQQSGNQQSQQSQIHQSSQILQNQQGSNQQHSLNSQSQPAHQQVIQSSSSASVAQGNKHHAHPVATSASHVSSQQQPQNLPLTQVPSLSHTVPLNETPQTSSSPTSHLQQTSMESKEEKSPASVSNSKLNPNAKEFIFNPNAKPFSPVVVTNVQTVLQRSPNTTTPPRTHTPQIQPSQPQQMGAGGVPSINFPQNMVPAYVMQHYQMQQPRFTKRVPVGNQRQDYASSMQVAAATGHPILAPAPLTPITAPQAISAVQIPQNMMAQAAQQYHYQMPMMVRFPGPGIPMVTTMVPTSMGMYHQMEAHQNSHGHPQHLYMGPAAGVAQHQQHQPHPSVTPGPHPGQPPTPQGHNNAGGPNQLPNMPPQPPTPGPTPPQTMMYGGPAGAQMGGQPTIPQHIPHSAQSPHNQYPGNHNAALAAAAAASASHHASATQLVMLPPHMTHHMLPPGAPPHSATGHIPSSIAGYTPTSSGAMQHMNHGAQLHYIQAGAPPVGQGHYSIVHHNQ